MKRSIIYIVALAGIVLYAGPSFATDDKHKGEIDIDSSTGAGGAPAAISPSPSAKPPGPQTLGSLVRPVRADGRLVCGDKVYLMSTGTGGGSCVSGVGDGDCKDGGNTASATCKGGCGATTGKGSCTTE